MPELRRLRYAVAVADELNFTRAAERLGVSQQVLSEQIRRLEDELGLQVFDRTTRQVRVTSPGRQILDEARAVVGAADALRDRARRLASAQAGVVRLGYSRSTAFDTAPLVSAVTEVRPELRVEVREGRAASCRRRRATATSTWRCRAGRTTPISSSPTPCAACAPG